MLVFAYPTPDSSPTFNDFCKQICCNFVWDSLSNECLDEKKQQKTGYLSRNKVLADGYFMVQNEMQLAIVIYLSQ